MMYELVQVAPHTYYIQSPAKIGLVVLDETSVCLIDSGNDKSAGRKIRQILDANHWQLKAIYNTHSHADHIGGNQYLYAQTGCSIYAPGIDCAFTQHPLLEPCFLYGGCPPEDLRHKFLMAQESPAQPLTPDVLPSGFEMMPFPGHGLDMVGFRTPDDVVFLADCLSSRETLEKYRIGFIYDVGAYLDTLERVKTLQAAHFIPAHAAATDDIAPLARLNSDATRQAEGAHRHTQESLHCAPMGRKHARPRLLWFPRAAWRKACSLGYGVRRHRAQHHGPLFR